MKISTPLKTLFTLGVALSLSFSANAHRAWVLPSSTSLSGEAPWVTFDAAVSNSLFVFEHVPLRMKGLMAQDPTGKLVEVANAHTGKYRSTFDLNLVTEGTYKVGYAMGGLRASWKDSEGKRKRWPARGKTANAADFAKEVPKDADSLKVSDSYRRIETYVTAGEPSNKVFEPTNKGLELVPETHPNDLFAGETAKFQFLFHGEAVAGVKLAIVKGGTRYRNDQKQIDVVTDAKGYANITWPEAGMYLIEAEYKDNKATAPATIRTGSYSATFAVFPE
ncbi:DUF4198 domain-containing protein [Colwellia sp. E2M01]|uniref:DUF4198 domain-containing protein n=1 Tax=Colwellia sp. E2M01 TaxID=2841561 RepID=UPI001C0A1E3D|nr:DUF4198 domain-containing protein [Colwellia sp. E2M01]MBU2870922.1 DUF4198 domain-containing protein [Colwellia sp. E2M01]